MATAVPGIGGPSTPFFSPDGNWVGFYEVEYAGIKKIPVTGGSAVQICPVNGTLRGVTWADDGTIIFALSTHPGLWRVASSGGTPELLVEPGEGGKAFEFPDALSGGRTVLFAVRPASAPDGSKNQLAVLSLETRKWQQLTEGGTNPHYSPSGHIIFNDGNNLRAIQFDRNTLEVHGPAMTVLPGVMTKANTSVASFGVSVTGTLAYLKGTVSAGSSRTLVWVDRDGSEESIAVPLRAYAYPRVSPDGTRIAVDIRDQENDIWIWDIARKNLIKLTIDPGPNRGVAWTPDSKRIAFSSVRDGHENLYWQAADGSGAAERLTTGDRPQVPSSFTPDGKALLFAEPGSAPYDLRIVAVDGEARGRSRLLLHSSSSERAPEVSPDGRWLAYQSNETGRDEVFVRPFPAIDSGRWQVSNGGGTRPAWSPKGDALYYFQPGKIIAVPILSGTTFAAGVPAVIVKGAYVSPQDGRGYDLSPDGKRSLMIKESSPAGSPPTELVVALNWSEELKAKVQ